MRQCALVGCIALAVMACADQAKEQKATQEPIEPLPVAALLSFDTYSAPLGTSVGVFGAQFPSEPNEHGRKPLAELTFRGVFEGQDRLANEVDKSVLLHRKSDGSLVWDSFGPYRNPFTNREAVGTFEGTATVRFYDVGEDGLAGDLLTSTPAQALRFTVEPSVFIRRFRPLDSRCADPVEAALAHHPYELEVAAVGRDVRSFSFTLAASYPSYDDGSRPAPATPLRVDVPALLNTATAGENTAFVVPPMPLGATSYLLELGITAHTVDGYDIPSFTSMVVHNPIAMYTVGRRKLAQTYDPVMQGNCFEPGVSTSKIDYRETHTETRTVSKTVSYSNSWGMAVQSGTSQATGETTSAATNYSVARETSSTDGTSTTHESQWKVGAKASVKVTGSFFGAGVESMVEVSAEYGESDKFTTNNATGRRDATTEGSTQTLGTSRTSTTSETLSQNLSEGRSSAETYLVTSTDSTSQGYTADIFPETAAVWYSQLSRYMIEAIIVRYNLCGEEEVIGTSQLTDWSWAVDISYGTSCSPVPEPDDFEPGRCLLGNCEG